MIMQVFLSAVLLCILVYAYSQKRRSALVCYVVMAIACCGLLLVALPESSNMLAAFVGIGRGADLVMYCFILFAFVAILSLHLHVRAVMEAVTENTRRLALIEARLEDMDKN